jgi:hypothetical protein
MWGSTLTTPPTPAAVATIATPTTAFEASVVAPTLPTAPAAIDVVPPPATWPLAGWITRLSSAADAIGGSAGT